MLHDRTPTCPTCGLSATAEGRYCARCGVALPPLAAPSFPPTVTPPYSALPGNERAHASPNRRTLVILGAVAAAIVALCLIVVLIVALSPSATDIAAQPQYDPVAFENWYGLRPYPGSTFVRQQGEQDGGKLAWFVTTDSAATTEAWIRGEWARGGDMQQRGLVVRDGMTMHDYVVPSRYDYHFAYAVTTRGDGKTEIVYYSEAR
jgi:hypothetical protein